MFILRYIVLSVVMVYFGCEALSTLSPTNSIATTTIPTVQKLPPIRRPFRRKVENNSRSGSATEKLPWIQEGYCTWNWRGHKINYLEMGDESKPALLLIHGFGASAYHFRYNIPALAKHYHVYAFDLLGFGLSSKPVQDYSEEIWRDQATDFINDVIQKPTAIAGNSLGGFTALYAAATDRMKHLITGCILMNAAGKFRNTQPADTTANANVFEPTPEKEKNWLFEKTKGALLGLVVRLIASVILCHTKQPARIEQVLRLVYPVNSNNVDRELVESILYPSLDPNAAEVFYRLNIRHNQGPAKYIDDLVKKLECPLMLCWGEQDPCIPPTVAEKIKTLHPKSIHVSIDAGHCPHDEAPEAVNLAIHRFMKQL